MQYTVLKMSIVVPTSFVSEIWVQRMMAFDYSIVKDSSADLGVIFRIVQNRPNCLNQLMSQLYERQTH